MLLFLSEVLFHEVMKLWGKRRRNVILLEKTVLCLTAQNSFNISVINKELIQRDRDRKMQNSETTLYERLIKPNLPFPPLMV